VVVDGGPAGTAGMVEVAVVLGTETLGADEPAEVVMGSVAGVAAAEHPAIVRTATISSSPSARERAELRPRRGEAMRTWRWCIGGF